MFLVLTVKGLLKTKIKKVNPKDQDNQKISLKNGLTKNTALTSFLKKGSLTLEAAMVLPLFLMFIVSLLTLFTALNAEVQIKKALEKTGNEIAAFGYESAAITTGILAEKYLTENMGIDLGKISDLSFLGSGYNPVDGNIVLVASYQIGIPFLQNLGLSIPMKEILYHRAWIGKNTEDNETEEMVFVTETGTVYHKSRTCSHLALKIREIGRGQLEGERNSGGGKYTPCEHCGKKGAEVFYITPYGNRYHTNRNCSGLKRTVQSVPLSQVGDLPPCSKCG